MHTIHFASWVLAAACTGLVAYHPTCAAQTDNLVKNGGFETDPVTVVRYFSGNDLNGWVVDGTVEVRENTHGQAIEGLRFAELDGLRNSGISQVLDTVAGTSYTLTFQYANRPGTPSATNGLSFDLGEGPVELEALPVQPGTQHGWVEYAYTFTAKGPTRLSFHATGISDAVGSSLDDVRVTPVAAYHGQALLLVGLGVAGVAGGTLWRHLMGKQGRRRRHRPTRVTLTR